MIGLCSVLFVEDGLISGVFFSLLLELFIEIILLIFE